MDFLASEMLHLEECDADSNYILYNREKVMGSIKQKGPQGFQMVSIKGELQMCFASFCFMYVCMYVMEDPLWSSIDLGDIQ